MLKLSGCFEWRREVQPVLTLRSKKTQGLATVKTSPRPDYLINLSHLKMRLNDNLNKSLNIIQIHIKKDKDLTQHPEITYT